MNHSFTYLLPLIIAGTLLLAVITGLATGLVGLWRCQRGAAWWGMCIGTVLCLASPLLLTAASFQEKAYLERYLAAEGAGQPLPQRPNIDIYYGSSIVVDYFGLLVFASGFVHHGTETRRRLARSRELEQGLAVMDRQITLLKAGKNVRPMIGAAPQPAITAQHVTGVTVLLAGAGVIAGIWASWAGLTRLFDDGEKPFLRVSMLVLAAFAVGIWTGLCDLRRAQGSDDPNSAGGPKPRRGAGLWLMTSGALCSLVPALGALFLIVTDSTDVVDSLDGVLYAVLFLVMPLGIVFFTSGFALHGLKAARHRERIAELGQLSAAMEEEMSRMKPAPVNHPIEPA